MKKTKIKKLALTAVFSAVIAASSWISIATPFGVNLTLQMFAVSLAGFCLGAQNAVAATLVYIVMGAIGMPVFSSFTGGFGVLFGASGGFLWGFLAVALFCGISKSVKTKVLKVLLPLAAIIVCHLAGIIQYSVVTGNTIWVALITASLPFLAKDFIFVFVSSAVSKKIKI